MNLIRWFIVGILGLAFAGLLIATIVVTSVLFTVSDKNQLKVWLSESGVYVSAVDRGVDFVYERIGQDAVLAQTGMSDEATRAMVKEVLAEEWIESQVEEMIDGVYGWLEGETVRPEFELDLGERKPQVVEAIAQLTGNVAMAEQMLEHAGFMNDVRFTGEDLQLPDDLLTRIPEYFSLLRWAPQVLVAVLLVLVVAIVLLATSRKSGILFVGMLTVISALPITGFAFLVRSEMDEVLHSLSVEVSGEKQEPVLEILNGTLGLIGSDLLMGIGLLGSVVTLFGVGLLFLGMMRKV
jgi:hypothetical protein